MKVNIEVDCTPDEARRFLGPAGRGADPADRDGGHGKATGRHDRLDGCATADGPVAPDRARGASSNGSPCGRSLPRRPRACRGRPASRRNSAGLPARHDLRAGDGRGPGAGRRPADQRAGGRGGGPPVERPGSATAPHGGACVGCAIPHRRDDRPGAGLWFPAPRSETGEDCSSCSITAVPRCWRGLLERARRERLACARPDPASSRGARSSTASLISPPRRGWPI